MACKRLVNGTEQPSILFDYIYNNITNQNEERAQSLYTYFKSEVFKEEFGNWEEDFKSDPYERTIKGKLVDDNGEPRLFYDKAKGAHFYETKTGTKVFYPDNFNKLNELYTHEAIRKITKTLALKFLEPRLNNNFEDINFESMDGTLSEFLESVIREKASELQAEEDFDLNDKGYVLEESLQYKDEWIRHIENFYRELKLVYKEKNETEEMIEDEENTREGQTYGQSSFEKSSKDNITSNIKLRLSLLRDSYIDANGELQYVRDEFFNEPSFVSFDEVYSTLQKALTDQVALEGEDLFEIYESEIKKLRDKKPYFSNLVQQLETINDYQKAELVQAFNLSKNNFIGSMFQMVPIKKGKDIIGYETIFSVQNLSNAGGKNRLVKNNWFYNFNKKFSSDKGVYTQEARTKYGETKKSFKTYFTGVKSRIKSNEYNEDNFHVIVNSMVKVLEDLGIATNREGFMHYLDGLSPLEVTFEEKLKNFNRLLEATNYFLDNTKLGNSLSESPFDSQAEFNKLADAHSFYISEGSDASIFSVGKSKWVYSYPSYLSNKIKTWKKSRDTMLHQYHESPHTKSSHYFKYFLGIDENFTAEEAQTAYEERIDNFELNIFNSLQEPGDTINAVDNFDMSKNDAFADNSNKILGFRKEHNQSFVSSPTPADKSTYYQFSIPKDLMVEANAEYYHGKVEFNESVKKIIYNYVKAEFERIQQARKEIELAGDDYSNLIVHYHLKMDKETGQWVPKGGNALKFQLFESLNEENFDAKEMGFELYKDGQMLDLTLEDITATSDLMDMTDTVSLKVVDLITKVVGERILGIRDHLVNIEMIEKIEEDVYINKGFDTEIWNSYSESQPHIKAAADIFVNNLISQIEYTKLFSGDIAYYKNHADYNKRVPATYTDGQQLYLKEGQKYFNASIINSVEGSIPLYDIFEETYGKEIAEAYKDTNVADAQAWITPARWKFLKQGLGHWSFEHDTVFDKIMGTNKEPFTVAEMKLSAQPLKGVYFDINNGVPTFLKYSQAVLTPALIRNNKGLNTLSEKMKEANIDELITLDGIKVGSNLPITAHDIDNNVTSDFKLNTLQLKNSGWKLQQDLPIKTDKQTDIGSQIQKNIFAGIAYYDKSIYNVDGVNMSNNQLIQHINKLFNNLSDLGLTGFFEELGIDQNYKITKPELLNKALLIELKESGGSQNVIDALETGITTYAIPGLQQKIQNSFSSMVLKRVIKIQSNGGSYIQMSNFGFSKSEADNNGVIYTPWADEKTMEPTVINDGNIVESFKGFWSREEVQKDQDKVYLFGDNTDDRVNTKYVPKSTQAVIRNLDNAIGIDTKKNRGTSEDSYLTDADFVKFKKHVDQQVDKAIKSGKTIVIPEDGIGTGKAMLSEKAPKLAQYLNEKLEELKKSSGRSRVKPGGILISGSFIAKYLPNYRDYANDPDKLFGTAKNNYNDGLIDKKILDSIIGYRIPNQGLASNDALQIVGILPEENGDTVVAYTGITTKTGSDFDIDKMYIMMPNMQASRQEYKKLRDYVWNNLRGENMAQTVENVSELLDQFSGDENLSKMNHERFVKMLLSNTNKDLLNSETDYLIEAILKSNIPLAQEIKNSIEGFAEVSKISYNNNKETKEGMQNQIIQAYKSVLTNPDIINDIMKPIDHPYIKDDILNLYPEESREDLTTFNIKDQLDLKYEFIAGQAGVGITANQLVDHVRGQMANNYLEYLDIGTNETNLNKLDNEYSETLTAEELAYYEKEINRGKKKGEKRIDVSNLASIKIADAMSAIMNANVDIANDSYITRGNWVTQTSNVGLMLLRAGVHPFKVNAIIGHPILKEYVDFVNNSESKIVKQKGNLQDKFRDKLIMRELDSLGSVDLGNISVPYSELYLYSKYGTLDRNLNRLSENKINKENIITISKNIKLVVNKFYPKKVDMNKYSLKKLRSEAMYSTDQKLEIDIFHKFGEWIETAKDLGLNMKAAKIDVNGYGKNVTSMIINMNVIDKLLSSEIKFIGFEQKLDYQGESTLLNGYKRNALDEVFKVMKANPLNFLMALDNVVNTFNEISRGITGEPLLQEKLADKLENSYYTYFMSGFPALQTSTEEKLSLLESIPKRVQEYKDANKNNKSANKMLIELDVKVGENNRNFAAMSNRKKSPATQTELINSWKDLLEEDSEFATDLIKYSVLTSGLQMSINQFHTYIPYEFFAMNDINSYVEQVALDSQNGSMVDSSFLDSFFRHNLKDDQIVRRIFDNQISKDEREFVYGSAFIIEKPGRGNYYVKKEINLEDPLTGDSYSELELYKLEGYDVNERAIYTRAQPIGLADKRGNKVFEYEYDSLPAASALSENVVKDKRIVSTRDGVRTDTRDPFKNMIAMDRDGQVRFGQNHLTANNSENVISNKNTVNKDIELSENEETIKDESVEVVEGNTETVVTKKTKTKKINPNQLDLFGDINEDVFENNEDC